MLARPHRLREPAGRWEGNFPPPAPVWACLTSGGTPLPVGVGHGHLPSNSCRVQLGQGTNAAATTETSPRSLESWVKEPQEAWQMPWLCRQQLGAGGGTAGHPGFPPEVTISPWFPPQKGGPRVRLAEHRPASQPHPGGAESRARARFPKAPAGVPGPHVHPPERGQLQTQQPGRNLRPARLAVPLRPRTRS